MGCFLFSVVYFFHRTEVAKYVGHIRWLKTTEIYSLTVLEARSTESRCQKGHAPSKNLGENPSLPSSFKWLAAVLGLPCLSSLYPHCHKPFFPLGCVQISLFLEGHQSLDLRPILIQYELINPLNLITSGMTLFPDKVTFTGSES